MAGPHRGAAGGLKAVDTIADMPRPAETGTSAPPPGLLFYAMYAVRGMARAPEVRINLIGAALERRTHVERIVGGRWERLSIGLRWFAGGGPRRVRAVYVELATSTAFPQDIAFLLLMRLLGRPVGIYFRDAYQLYRDLFPVTRFRQRLADMAWRLTMPMLRSIATHRFAPSAGLAEALGLRDAIILSPGTDPSLPDLGIGEPNLVAALVAVTPASGFPLLLASMGRVREKRPEVRLRVVASAVDDAVFAELPEWVDIHRVGRAGIADVLSPARVCVLPLPVTAYSNLAVPVRIMDFLSFGKPIVSTASTESRRVLDQTGAGIAVADEPGALAEAIGLILDDERLAAELGRRARAAAEDPARTWDGRAATILTSLLPQAGWAPDG